MTTGKSLEKSQKNKDVEIVKSLDLVRKTLNKIKKKKKKPKS
jgi:hypothetical protein